MEVNRKPFQGVLNVLRFNWHFYIAFCIASTISFVGAYFSHGIWSWLLYSIFIAATLQTIISLYVTYLVYDASDLYQLKWLNKYAKSNTEILNVSAGFDETSPILKQKFKHCPIHICDFYDPRKHTEISIKRARKAYPPDPDTLKVETQHLPYSDDSFDLVCITFAAHEIRNFEERQQFFKELGRITKLNGKLFVTEHLRDFNNFMAYTIGFFHFYARITWKKIFHDAHLALTEEVRSTSFVTTFVLKVHGPTS